MAVDFSQFSTKTSALSTDYIVGYDANASGGEKKYTVSTLANAVSSIASLGTVKSVTGTAPISVANETTTPAISIDTNTIAKAWLKGTIGGLNSAGATTSYAYNCSLVYVKRGVVRILFNKPFLTQNSFVFSWGGAESGTVHHIIAESSTSDSGLSYTRTNTEIVLGCYAENGALETTDNSALNVVFFGV